MQNKNLKGSLSEIVNKMNETYGELISGFSPGINRRVMPVVIDGEVTGWKMQFYENDVWVDLDEEPFGTMEKLIEHYKNENEETLKK